MAVRTESSICRADFLYDIDIKQVKRYIRLTWRPSLGACPPRALSPSCPPSRALSCLSRKVYHENALRFLPAARNAMKQHLGTAGS